MKNDETAYFRMEIGRLLWKHVRNYVGEANALGYGLSLWEGVGFIARPFVISGSPHEIEKVKHDFLKWKTKLDNEP